ncbi:unknown [Bacillus sp. CAG:988]|nr:unknown [Bacillus sp. CAG:988]
MENNFINRSQKEPISPTKNTSQEKRNSTGPMRWNIQTGRLEPMQNHTKQRKNFIKPEMLNASQTSSNRTADVDQVIQKIVSSNLQESPKANDLTDEIPSSEQVVDDYIANIIRSQNK